MSEPATPADNIVVEQDVESLREEVERLRAENERLSTYEVASEQKSHRARNGWAITLVIIGALLIALAVPAVWLNRVVFDTDKWVETVAPLSQDPAIQNVVATAASDAIIEKLNAEQLIKDILPDQLNLDRFAPVLAGSVESAIRTQASTFVKSEQFSKLWAEINRVSHKALITAITGREGALSIQAGTFTLDTGLLADKVKAALSDKGLGFVNRIPTSALDRQIVLYQSDALAAAGPIIDMVQKLAFIIPVLGILLVGGAFGLAVNRQKVALWLGIMLTVFAVLPLQILYLGQYTAVSRIEQSSGIPAAAVQNAFSIIFRDLATADRTLAFLGIVVLIGAVLAGPARWAVAMRAGMSGGLAQASSHLELGRFGEWVAAHKSGLRMTGFLLAAIVLLMLPAPRTIESIIWLAVFVVIWLVAVEFFGASQAAVAPAETAPAIPAGGEVVEAPEDETSPADVEASGTDSQAEASDDEGSASEDESPADG
jgi:hypothetical protein